MNHRLSELRNALLDLHKTLADSERSSYESTFGVIRSRNQFLQHLIRDPWFAWLQPLSQLIVEMDEALEEKEPLTQVRVEILVSRTGLLLVASEAGEGFGRHYYDALQRDPNVVLAHAVVVKQLGPRKRLP